jgi:ribosomal protein L7/L12
MREVLMYIPETEKIKQIKAIRAAYGVGLKEAKELMEDYHASK